MSAKGFTLIELLIALCIFMITVLFSIGCLRGILDLTFKINGRTETMAALTELFFGLRSGERDDLFWEGGKQKEGEVTCAVESREDLFPYRQMKLSGSRGRAEDALTAEIYLRGEGESKVEREETG